MIIRPAIESAVGGAVDQATGSVLPWKSDAIANPWDTHSLNFDGSGEYGSCGDQADLGPEHTQAFTYLCWIRTTGSASFGAILSKRDTASPFPGCQLGMLASGKLRCGLTSDGYSTTTTSVASIDDDAWHMVAVCWDGSADLQNIVDNAIDGVSLSNSFVNTITNNAPFGVCARTGTSGTELFPGKLTHALVVHQDLSATQALIDEAYNGGKPYDYRNASFAANIKLFLPIGEGQDDTSTLYDLSGNGYNCSLTSIEAGDFTTDVP